jgi:hypothetical protein
VPPLAFLPEERSLLLFTFFQRWPIPLEEANLGVHRGGVRI